VARAKRQVTDDQPGGKHFDGLRVFRIDADIADVRICQRHDLPAIGRISQDFLIAGHRGVEYDFPAYTGLRPYRNPPKYRAIGEHEYGGLTGVGRQDRLPGNALAAVHMESGRGTRLSRFIEPRL